MEVYDLESDVHFGEIKDRQVDWRSELIDDEDPDDEELETTPADVVAILGFDPKDM